MFYFLSYGRGRVQMTHEQAMKLLDKVKDGVPYPEKIINMALEITGDLVV